MSALNEFQAALQKARTREQKNWKIVGARVPGVFWSRLKEEAALWAADGENRNGYPLICCGVTVYIGNVRQISFDYGGV